MAPEAPCSICSVTTLNSIMMPDQAQTRAIVAVDEGRFYFAVRDGERINENCGRVLNSAWLVLTGDLSLRSTPVRLAKTR